jgi:hypothetical protein
MTFTSCPSHLRPFDPGCFGLRVSWPARPSNDRLVCASCSSGRSFACVFLPTTPHDAAVAVQLGIPATRAPRGLTPPSHRAMPGAPKKAPGVRHAGGFHHLIATMRAVVTLRRFYLRATTSGHSGDEPSRSCLHCNRPSSRESRGAGLVARPSRPRPVSAPPQPRVAWASRPCSVAAGRRQRITTRSSAPRTPARPGRRSARRG